MSVPDGMTTQLSYLEVATFYLFLNLVVIITSGQSDLTTGRIAAAHGRFSGIGQVAPVCTPILNMVLWAHQSPQPKHHLSRFSCFCTAHGRVFLYITVGCPFPPSKLTLSMWGSGPPTNTWYLEPTTQMASRSVQLFLQGLRL